MSRALCQKWGRSAAMCGLVALLCPAMSFGQSPVPAAGQPVKVPPITYVPGDNLDPLPKGAPLPPSDPRIFEGIWASLGHEVNVDGSPPPYRPEIRAEMERLRKLDNAGTPVIAKNRLCRPKGPFVMDGNQFPTQFLQRSDKMLVLAEEGRTVYDLRIGGKHPPNVELTYGGDSVAHWEGNMLVIDSIGHKERLPAGPLAGNSTRLHLVTRLVRANTGDPLNGERLLMYRTFDDPGVYTKPWTGVSVMRWRPDLQVLDFNCEESSEDEINEGLDLEH